MMKKLIEEERIKKEKNESKQEKKEDPIDQEEI